MANAMHAYSTYEIKASIERLKRLYSVAGEGQRLNNSDDLRSCSLAGQFHYYGFFFFFTVALYFTCTSYKIANQSQLIVSINLDLRFYK